MKKIKKECVQYIYYTLLAFENLKLSLANDQEIVIQNRRKNINFTLLNV